MDRITKSYVDEFSKMFGYTNLTLPQIYCKFSNYCVVSKHLTNETFTNAGQDIVSEASYTEFQYDGFAILMNGHLVPSRSSIDDFLHSSDNVEIEIIVIMTKTSVEDIKPSVIYSNNLWDTFSSIFEDRSMESFNEQNEDESLLSYLYSKSSLLSAHRFPELHVYFVADVISDDLIQECNNSLLAQVNLFENKHVFSSIHVNVWKNNDLISAYNRSKFRENVTIMPIDTMPFPKIRTINDGYIALVAFSEFKKLIIDENGAIMTNVFHDNIRAYQGNNVVNQSMKDSIVNGKIEEFVLMNNGITVVASDISFVSKELTLSDYQIVNGCQTCHVLYNNRFVKGIDNLVLMVRIIGSKDIQVRNAIILGTNSQTVVRREQLMALSELQERIENLYRAMSKPEQLYYERRSKQYLSETSVPQYKVITIPVQIMTFVSMFIGEPHNVTGYYSQIIVNLERNNKKVFSEDYYIGTYYTSGLAYYKLSRLQKVGFIPREYASVKYHLLYAFRLAASEGYGDMPSLENAIMENYCDMLNNILWDDVRCKSYFMKAKKIVDLALDRMPKDSDGGNKNLTQRVAEVAHYLIKTGDRDIINNFKEDFKKRILSKSINYLTTYGESQTISSISLLTRHASKRICMVAGNLFSYSMNDVDVVNAIGQFLNRGGEIRMLMYNYKQEKIIDMPLFKRLAAMADDNNIEIRLLQHTPQISYNGQNMSYNLYSFDENNIRLELQDNFHIGKIWLYNPEEHLVFQSIFDKVWKENSIEKLDLKSIFKLN